MSDRPARSRLLGAAVVGTLVALAGLVAAFAVGSLVAVGLDDGSFLAGVIEGLFAGVLVLGAAAVATVMAVRAWVGRGSTAVLDWGWATLAVVAGILSVCALWTVGGLISDAADSDAGDLVFGLCALASVVAGPASAYAVLRGWAAR